MLLNVLVTTSAVYWLLRELYLLFCLPALDMHAVDVDEHLVIPEAIDIMLEGMLDAICFVLGCMLLLLAASTFLKKFGSNDNPTDAIILTYPLLFGPPALLRIFLCICRRLLYHALFKHGVIIDFSKGVSQHDFLLSWSYLGFVVAVGILIFDAYIRVHEGQVTAKAMTINVIVFTSPLYYMISSLLNSLRVEQEAIKRTCLQKLGKTYGPDAPEEVSPSAKHKLCPLAEGSICRAARERKDLHLSIKLAKEAEDRHDSDERFGLRDMFWVPRLVSGTGRSTCGALLLVISMPAVAFLTMLLALVSMAWFIKHRTDIPEMGSIVADVPGLHPSFTPEVQNYAFFILNTYSGFTLTSEADPERTTFLKNAVFDGSTEITDASAESTSGVLIHTVPLRRVNATYPTTVYLTAGTFSQVQTYRITVIHVKPTFRTLMLRGIVDNGNEYTECIPGKNVGHSILTIPDNLVSLRVEAAFDQFYFGIPFTDARPNQITTIFMSNRDDYGSVGKWRCDGWCQRQLQCLGFQDSREGCYFAMAPTGALRCGNNNAEPGSQSLVETLNLTAQICSTVANDLVCIPSINTETGLVHADISQLVLADDVESPAVMIKATMISASTLHNFLQQKVYFQLDTPKVRLLVKTDSRFWKADTDPSKVTYSMMTWVVQPGWTSHQKIDVSMHYDPLLSQSRNITMYFAALLDDEDFYFEWPDDEATLLDTNKIWVEFRECNESESMAFYDVCGGPWSTSLATVTVDKWSPRTLISGIVRPRNKQSVFRNREVSIMTNYAEGRFEALQDLVYETCSVPICRGHLDECMEAACKSDSCKERCLSEAHRFCTEDPQRRGGYYMGTVIPRGLSPSDGRTWFTRKPFRDWIYVDIFPEFRRFFTREVVVDIAEHCPYRSGLFSLVRHQMLDSLGMPAGFQILEALARNRNRDVELDTKFDQNPVLKALFDNSKEDFLKMLPLPLVAMYRPKLSRLLLPVCLATDPKSSLFSVDLFTHFVDKIIVDFHSSDSDGYEKAFRTLNDLVKCVQRKGRSFKPFASSQCRGSASFHLLPDGTKPSLLSLAPSEKVFKSLVQVCNVSGVLDHGKTVLHLAAEKGYISAMKLVFAQKRDLPDVNAGYSSTRSGGKLRVHVDGITALHNACEVGCPDCVQLLLAHGAKKEAMTDLTAFPTWFDAAIHPWMYEALTDFREKGHKQFRYPVLVNVQPLHMAVKNTCQECIEQLLQHHVDVNAQARLGYEHSYYQRSNATRSYEQVSMIGTDACVLKPLDLALAFGTVEMVKKFMAAGADMTSITVDSKAKLLNNADFLKRLNIVNSTQNALQIDRCQHWKLADAKGEKKLSPGLLLHLF